MVKQYRDKYAIPTLLILLALAIWLLLMHQFRLDDSFITYRYARHLAAGRGLVYNTDDVVLSTTAPLYAMLLAAGSFLISDFHVLGGLVGALAIGAGGGLVYTLLPSRISMLWRAWGGLLYVLSTPLWLALGMETPLWIMLVLLAVYCAQAGKWAVTGLVIGIATLVRPDAALPGVLLGLVALGSTVNQVNTRRQWWRTVVSYAAAAAVPVLCFAVWGIVTYGSPLPVTLGAKSAQAELGITGLGPHVGIFEGLRLIVASLIAQSPFYLLAGVLMLVGLWARPAWTTLFIALWGALHLLAYAVLGTAPYRWYYVPLLPGVILLAVYGVDYMRRWLVSRLHPGAANVVVGVVGALVIAAPVMSFSHINRYFETGGEMDVMLPIVDWQVYREVGEWLNANTPADATVGVAEVGQVGFYADRWMTDYLGLLQPDVADMLERGDLYSWLAKYAPDYLVFQRFRGAPLVLYNYLIGDDAWFRASYREVAEFDDPRYSSGPVTIFERTTALKQLQRQEAQADYDGLRLVGLATDGDSITQPGETARIRLDWQVTGSLPANLHLAVKALDLPVFPSFDADYQTENWRGTFSTWHAIVWPDEAVPGSYPLHVAVGPTGGPYNGQNVGWFYVRSSP